MNPKNEFVKSLINNLKLDSELYTLGAVEKVIDRLEQDDYINFLILLGSRKSDYEIPMAKLINGVDEFIAIKYRKEIAETKKLVSAYQVLSYYFPSYSTAKEVYDYVQEHHSSKIENISLEEAERISDVVIKNDLYNTLDLEEYLLEKKVGLKPKLNIEYKPTKET